MIDKLNLTKDMSELSSLIVEGNELISIFVSSVRTAKRKKH